jgi:hypothetical protein
MSTRFGIAAAVASVILTGCASRPLPPAAILPKGGVAYWNQSITYWDRNGDGKPDRIRIYQGSGYASEYFDDGFDGDWDGMEHAPNRELATGLKEKRVPGGLDVRDRERIAWALTHCVSAR